MSQAKVITGYIVVKPYPLHKEGDIIRKISVLGNKSIFTSERTKDVIDEKILNTEFFKPMYFEFEVGQEVLYNNLYRKIRPARVEKINADSTVELLFLDSLKPRRETVNYTKITKGVIYYFINSTFDVCEENAISATKIEKMNKRVSNGNFFLTKEKASEFRKKVIELSGNMYNNL